MFMAQAVYLFVPLGMQINKHILQTHIYKKIFCKEICKDDLTFQTSKVNAPPQTGDLAKYLFHTWVHEQRYMAPGSPSFPAVQYSG